MDRGALRATVRGAAVSQIRLSDSHYYLKMLVETL